MQLSDASSGQPDVSLKSAKGKIDADLSLLGKRPASIEADTRNHPLRLRVSAQNPIDVQASSGSGEFWRKDRLTSGAIHIWLPQHFDGELIAQCFGGLRAELSPRLASYAVSLPGKRDDYEWNAPEYRQSWRVRLPPDPDVEQGQCQASGTLLVGTRTDEEELQAGSSLIKATTVTGRIYFYHPSDDVISERSDRCAVM